MDKATFIFLKLSYLWCYEFIFIEELYFKMISVTVYICSKDACTLCIL